MFLDHTQRRSTVGRTPLDEWSARRRVLYLTTHDTHNRQISMPPVGFEPTISAGERPLLWTSSVHRQLSQTTGARNSCWRKATVWKRTAACTLVAEIWITCLSNIKLRLPATCLVGSPAHHWNQIGSNLTGFFQSRLQRNFQNNIREANTMCVYIQATWFGLDIKLKDKMAAVLLYCSTCSPSTVRKVS